MTLTNQEKEYNHTILLKWKIFFLFFQQTQIFKMFEVAVHAVLNMVKVCRLENKVFRDVCSFQ